MPADSYPYPGLPESPAYFGGPAAGQAPYQPPAPMRQESPGAVLDRFQPPGAVEPWGGWFQSEAEAVQVWDASSTQLATWIITEANQQAADIRHEAREHMTASLASAKVEADDLVRQANEHATATRTAAESEAAEIRATVSRLTAELGGVAARITGDLTALSPLAPPATRPASKPAAKPAPEPAARPAAQPVTEPEASPEGGPTAEPGINPSARPAADPGTRPARTPGTRPAERRADRPGAVPGGKPAASPAASPAGRPGAAPAGKPKGAPRQLVAARVAAASTAALVLFAVASGATEIALHGYDFFIFRSTGTGETGPGGLQEDQGPGQPDAPKPTLSHVAVKTTAKNLAVKKTTAITSNKG
jgi:hypothetical protein